MTATDDMTEERKEIIQQLKRQITEEHPDTILTKEKLELLVRKKMENELIALDTFKDNILNCYASSGNQSVIRVDGEIYDEKKSIHPDYDYQFTVFRGNQSRGFGFNFFYRPEADRVKVWGGQSFSFNEGVLDDDYSDSYSAEAAGRALEIAVNHLMKKYSQKMVVEPEEYRIGCYLAWDTKLILKKET